MYRDLKYSCSEKKPDPGYNESIKRKSPLDDIHRLVPFLFDTSINRWLEQKEIYKSKKEIPRRTLGDSFQVS